MSRLDINSTYSFSTLAPAILGATLQNALLKMSMSFDYAMKQSNVAMQYEQIYPVLPPGEPKSPAGVLFHLFVMPSGEKVYIADNWIDYNTLAGVTHRNFRIDVVNATTEQRSVVQQLLRTSGVDFAITDL